MGLTFKVNFTREDLKRRGMIRPEVLKAELLTAEREIVERTQGQKGIEGNALPGLSKGYAEYKASVGRNAIPDRTLTGDLLKAVHSQVDSAAIDRIEGRIFFQDGPHRKAPKAPGSKRKGVGASAGRTTIHAVAQAMQKLAPFFGLSRIQRQRLLEAVRKNLGK